LSLDVRYLGGEAPRNLACRNTSICFSEIEMSSRLASNVEPSCGTKAIGASLRSFASIG
jgi:hypothetical protein